MSSTNQANAGTAFAGGTLLSYLVATQPAPLQVSTVYTTATGIINISVTNPDGAYCKEIDLAFSYGTDPTCLFSAPPILSVNTSVWTAGPAKLITGRDLGLDSDIQYASFAIQCNDANYYKVNYNLVFSIQGAINSIVGPSDVLMQEISAPASDPNNWQTQKSQFTLSKSMPVFYCDNFVAAQIGNPTVPSSEFTNGADIFLSWASNGTWYQVYQKNVSTPVYAGIDSSFTLKGGVTTDTTFILVASMMSNPSGGAGGGSGFLPIYIYESLTVTISNPLLTPASVTASGAVSSATLSVSGAATLSGNTTVGGSLGVTAATTLAAATASGLTVTGQTTLAGVTASSANISGGATVSGLVTANGGATVGGTLTAANATISGLLTSVGSIAIVGTPQAISPATYTAPTDGFAVGYVGTPNDNTKICRTLIFGSAPGVSATAQGGNYCAFFRWSGSSGTAWLGGLQNSFCMPVKKGVNFSVSFWNDGNNEANAPTSFYWIPLGSGNVSALQMVGGPAPAPVEETAAVIQIASRAPDMHDLDISDLMGVMDDILGAYMNAEQRQRLQQAVRRIVYFETKDLK